MVTIEICIGSSCFVKGSNEVVELLKNYIAEHHLEEKGATLYNVVDLLEPELKELL